MCEALPLKFNLHVSLLISNSWGFFVVVVVKLFIRNSFGAGIFETEFTGMRLSLRSAKNMGVKYKLQYENI